MIQVLLGERELNQKKHTPGFQAVLVSDEAFDLLKQLQRRRYEPGTDGEDAGNGVRFDLKDIASAVVIEAMAVPDLPARAQARAAHVVIGAYRSLLDPSIPKELSS